MSFDQSPDTLARRSIARMIDSMWLIPVAAAVWFVAKYSVDVPYMDQWGLPSLFDDAAAGRPVLPGLLTCNNEHPVLFPKLIFLALAFTTSWNTRVEMAVTLLSALAMFLAIARLAAAEERDGVEWTTAISLFVASLLVFSFVHCDDWLWGWQLTFVLANTCAVLAVYLIGNSIRHPMRGQVLAWTCCMVASFSALYGLLSWLAIIPVQISLRRNKRGAAAALGSVVLLGLAIVVYFVALKRPFLYPVDRSFWLRHPVAALEFLCALVGAPLAQGNPISPATLAPFLGFALIALFALCAASLMRADRFPSAAPWVAIGSFGLGFAAMNTLGRSAWGVGVAASQSRYMGASVLVAVATLELCRQVMVKRRATFFAFAGVIAALSVAGSIASIPVARALKRERTRASAYLEVERYIDPATDKYAQSCLFPLFPVVPFTGGIRDGAEKLDALGFRKIVRRVPFIGNPSKSHGMFELSTKDGKPPIVRDRQAVEARGWASIPGGDRTAQIVLISVGDARVFITAAWMKAHRRRPRTQIEQPDQAAQPRWSVAIPAVFLPAGESVLKAWVYDSEKQEFVRLGDLNGENRVYKVP